MFLLFLEDVLNSETFSVFTVTSYISKYQGKFYSTWHDPFQWCQTTGNHTSGFFTQAAYNDWHEQCCGSNDLFWHYIVGAGTDGGAAHM